MATNNNRRAIQDILDKLDDATTELMTGEGDAVMLSLGDSFMECEEEFATDYCEQQQEVRSLRSSIGCMYACVCIADRGNRFDALTDLISLQKNGFVGACMNLHSDFSRCDVVRRLSVHANSGVPSLGIPVLNAWC